MSDFPFTNGVMALRWAAQVGHAQVMRLILENVRDAKKELAFVHGSNGLNAQC